jgi:cell division transport system permease protein
VVVNTFVTGWLAHSITWISFVDSGTVWLLSPLLVGGAVLLSVLASVISLRRYLKA